ncbi:MAG: hypothetical protein JNM78_19830 [Cyclobacteriaceae bacterium]|nr:hypothetical protein [Cyclobacteriaceae bacterium]
MIKTTLFVSLLFFSTTSQAQEYYVLNVKGHVKILKNEKELKTNDIIKANDKLIFSSEHDAVAVVNSKSGRHIIKPTPTSGSTELAALVKDILIPANNRLSTRNGGFNTPLDFQIYFADTVLLLDEMKHKVNNEYFPLSNDTFFFIRYNYQGEEINKKLFSPSDSLIINRAALFSIDGKPIDVEDTSDLKLFYLNGQNILFICALKISTPDLKALRTETNLLRKVLSTKLSERAAKEEILTYLQFQYGKIDLLNVEAWLKK